MLFSFSGSRRRWRVLATIAVSALLCVSPVRAERGGAPEQAAELVAQARGEIGQGDGIAAEAHLREAMDKGAAREAVAAYMGQALIAQGQLDRAGDWLRPGNFTRQTAPAGFRTLAQLYRLQGDLPAAGRAYDRVLALAPKDPTLWVEIARLRYAGGEHMLALDAANYAFQLDPGNVRTLELRGQIARDQDGLVAALPWFEKALAQSPEDVSVLGEYAATLGELGRARAMLKLTRKMLRLDPGNARAFYLQAVLAARAGKTGLARRLLNRVADSLDGVPAATLLEGILEMRAGNYVLATEAFEKLVRIQPGNAKARLLLVRALFQSGEYRALVIRFAAAADRADASPYLMTVIARAYEALGERDKAAPLLDRAALAPVRRGDGLRVADLVAIDEPAGAEAEAEQARTARPGNFDAQAHAGDVQLALGNGQAALARYALAARIRMPESLMLRMVAAYRLAGQNDRAKGLAEAYLARMPQSEAAGRLVASMAADAGDWRRARLLLEHVRANGAVRDVRLLCDLSLVQLRGGDVVAAEASAARAYRVQRASPLAAQAWGVSLAALGRQRKAAAALLDKAYRLMGDTPLIEEGRRRLAGKS